jgi:hypothetical protein
MAAHQVPLVKRDLPQLPSKNTLVSLHYGQGCQSPQLSK